MSPIFSLPILADGGKTAQDTGRADKAWAVAHADLGLHVARLMRAAVGGVHLRKKTLLKVSRGLRLVVPWGEGRPPRGRQIILGGKPFSRSWHTIVCHGRLYFVNEPSPMNSSYTPSFIHTQNQNISHHTRCTIMWTPLYPSCIHKQHQIYHRYTWATQLEDAAVSDRGWFRLPSACAGLPRRPGTSQWQPEPAPSRTQPKPPNRIVLVYQITLPQLLVCIQWYYP